MTGAERLRAAAALIRERAEVWEYHRGPWRTMPGAAGHTVVRCDTEVPADEFGPGGSMDTFVVDCDTTTTAEHIASWHPDAALAVALLLENEANALDGGHAPENTARTRLLTDLADRYLGATS